jgi:hypothetical protein
MHADLAQPVAGPAMPTSITQAAASSRLAVHATPGSQWHGQQWENSQAVLKTAAKAATQLSGHAAGAGLRPLLLYMTVNMPPSLNWPWQTIAEVMMGWCVMYRQRQ